MGLAVAFLAFFLAVLLVICVLGELADFLVNEAAFVGYSEFVVNGFLDFLNVLPCPMRGVLVGREDHVGELRVSDS